MASCCSPPNKPKLLLGTGNKTKQNTLRWLVEGLPLSPVTPSQLKLQMTIKETGDTHEAIARSKARQWSAAGSVMAISSDGGLVIPKLKKQWDSRFTHRFAGTGINDSERVQQLLKMMEPLRGPARQAWWVEGLAIAISDHLLASWELRGISGVIADTPNDNSTKTEFWAFSLLSFPAFDKAYNLIPVQESKLLDDHWIQLRDLVHGFFLKYLAKPMAGFLD
jgi:inosine/xanthosine triphosphate pyrophosphatase family protein